MTDSKTRNNRVFLDTMVLAEMVNPIDKMNRLINDGYNLVIPNTAVDVKAFQDNPLWLDKHLADGSIVIQMWMTPDEMVRKEFLWSSCGVTTKPAQCFEDAIEDLPNWDKIMQVKTLMEIYGFGREKWNPGQWSAPEPLSEEHKATLGAPDGATRTEILKLCRAANRMEIFDEYNTGYNRGLAIQHHCTYLMTLEGGVKEL